MEQRRHAFVIYVFIVIEKKKSICWADGGDNANRGSGEEETLKSSEFSKLINILGFMKSVTAYTRMHSYIWSQSGVKSFAKTALWCIFLLLERGGSPVLFYFASLALAD